MNVMQTQVGMQLLEMRYPGTANALTILQKELPDFNWQLNLEGLIECDPFEIAVMAYNGNICYELSEYVQCSETGLWDLFPREGSKDIKDIIGCINYYA